MASQHDIQKAVQFLQKGEIVGLPTETVYGLAADIRNLQALERVFAVKERPFFDPLIVHCSSIEQVKEHVIVWTLAHQKLAESFWPGPLTMVVPKKSMVSDLITSGLAKVGLRIPRHPDALAVIEQLRSPVAAPSANKFGKTSPTEARHVRDEFGAAVFVLDGGRCEVGIESTVLELEEGHDCVHVKVLRPGMIQEDEIRSALSTTGKKIEVKYSTSQAAPGQLAAHYQPSLPLVVWQKESSREKFEGALFAELGFKISEGVEMLLSPQASLAARELYSQLRQQSKSSARFIYFRETEANLDESWRPLWNRLNRAASFRF
jgi:L-threonylcarbamoyladenylate synthase